MKIEIGKIVKAQGIKGEVKIECYVDDAQMLAKTKQMYIGQNAYAVQKIRCDGRFCYVLLQGISDRNMAEELRGWVVFADKDQVLLKKDRYFVTDLVGCVVYADDGALVGAVEEVLQYGAADVFVCNGAKQVSFPFLKDLVTLVDVNEKKIVVSAKRLSEVAVYDED